jgi:deoxycytidylate deaminase/dephospho-CoA kinase
LTLAPQTLVIGMTGPFGSGCTTSSEILANYSGFHHIRLSQTLKDEWVRREPGKTPSRRDLQELGDLIRQKDGSGQLARLATEKASKHPDCFNKIVVDGIRNLGEIQFLRERFGASFFLFAFECPKSHRWQRLRPIYEKAGLTQEDFSADDKRDKDEEVAYGQQVQLCVDASDVLIVNDDLVTQAVLREKLISFTAVVTGEKPRYALPIEILMNMAYSASHGSKCLKRQVGAVLVDAEPGKMGEMVGTGFNDNPAQTAPCVEEPEYGADPAKGVLGKCFRDMVRFDSFVKLSNEKRLCPSCGTLIAMPSANPPWRCAYCGTHLEDFFWPERAMSWCTAIHAEVAALFAAGRRARGATLYTTSFPCFQCAEKIAQAGVGSIVYTEPYPDVKAGKRIDLAGIKVERFEGVRSARFHEIFSKARPYFETTRI